MKNILFFGFLLIFSHLTLAQTTTQGTVVNTSTNRLSVYGKPSIVLNNTLFDNINITLSIIDQGVGNPTVTVDSNFIPNLNWTPLAVEVTGGRAYYTFLGNDNGLVTTTSWSTSNNKVATFIFSNANGFNTAQMNDLSGTGGGGPNGQMYWYVQIIGGGDITDYTAKFYGTNPLPSNDPVNPSFVGSQPIGILPISMKDFNVAKQGTNNALLTWSTTFEQNASHFIIERSIKESSNWASIAEVKAKGNSSIETKYTYTDLNVYDGREISKSFFYRIRGIDLDGSEKIFPVRSIKFSTLGDKEISVFPNPAKGGFYVQIPIILRTDQKIRLNLMNRIGQVVDTREITAAVANNYYFDISAPSITSGDYVLDIIYDNQKLATKKLMISR
jgi:hypothetical protein